MMNFVRKVAAGVTAMFLSCLAWGGQRDTLLLTVDELFRMGMEMSLVLQADTLDCLMAGQSLRSARLAQAPDVEVGLTGGYLGQPVVSYKCSECGYPSCLFAEYLAAAGLVA